MALTMLFDLFPLKISKIEKHNFYFSKILALGFGGIGATFLMLKEGSGLFKKPANVFYLFPALIIAVDNFQFASFFAGKMQPINAQVLTWVLFLLYCFSTGFFEETIFRGVIFPLLATRFEKNKKGLLKTVIISSLIFGGAHLLNLFSGAGVGGTFLQACYSTLTGALFAFVLIKTKNVVFCAVSHGLYNFFGLLFSAEQGLGAGVVFDLPTTLTMLVVSLLVAGFAIFSFVKYTEDERVELYARLGFGVGEEKGE
jgi:membrane protease YdiL (CAAX protease family)